MTVMASVDFISWYVLITINRPLGKFTNQAPNQTTIHANFLFIVSNECHHPPLSDPLIMPFVLRKYKAALDI